MAYNHNILSGNLPGVWPVIPLQPTSATPSNTSSGTIAQIALNSFNTSITPSSEKQQRNESKRIRDADKIYLSNEPELWWSPNMPSEPKLVKLLFDWLSPEELSELESIFPINEDSDPEKLALLIARIKEISKAVQNDEFKVSHKHIFYLYQLYARVSCFTTVQNKNVNDIIGLVSDSFYSAVCALLKKISEITSVGDKLKVKYLDEITLLVRYANILSWPDESHADYLRYLIQWFVFKTEIIGSDPSHAESWRSVGYILDYVLNKCNTLLNTPTIIQQDPLYIELKAAVESIPSSANPSHFPKLTDFSFLESLQAVKHQCQTWKDSLAAGVEIQLPMLYHGCRKRNTFLKEIIETHIKDFEDQSRTVYTGAFLSTWPENLFGPPTASFSMLQLFRAPSDVIAKFDPMNDKVKVSASLANTRWISFKELVPVSLHELDGRKSFWNTIIAIAVTADNILNQGIETPDKLVIRFEEQRILAFFLRAFPFLVPNYFPDKDRNFIRPHHFLAPQQRNFAPARQNQAIRSHFPGLSSNSSKATPTTAGSKATPTAAGSKSHPAKKRKK